jgi:hypothetical protein
MREEGKSFKAAMQVEVSNHSKLRWSKAKVFNVIKKIFTKYQMRVKEMMRLNHC